MPASTMKRAHASPAFWSSHSIVRDELGERLGSQLAVEVSEGQEPRDKRQKHNNTANGFETPDQVLHPGRGHVMCGQFDRWDPCNICLGEPENTYTAQIWTCAQCGNRLHWECMVTWAKCGETRCPLCRYDFNITELLRYKTVDVMVVTPSTEGRLDVLSSRSQNNIREQFQMGRLDHSTEACTHPRACDRTHPGSSPVHK